MAAIMSLLQSLQPSTPQLCENNDSKFWCFKSKLLDEFKSTPSSELIQDSGIDFDAEKKKESSVNSENRAVDFFRPFINNYDYLHIIYALNCSIIAKNLENKAAIDHNDQLLEAHLVNALALANLLHVIKSQYFDSPKECNQLEREQLILRALLREFGYKFELIRNLDLAEDDEEILFSAPKPVSKWLRENTSWVNWPRLLIVRMKRVLDALIPMLKGLPGLVHTILVIDEIANPLFAYLAWIFYVPRLTLNLFLFFKNILPHPWMSIRQKQLGFFLRMKFEVDDRWFELGNDGVWLVVGFINCFVLVGTLQPWAIYLTVCLYAFDVALSALRAYVELNKLHQVRDKLLIQAKDNPYSQELSGYLDELNSELNRRISYEAKRVGLSLLTTLGLFLGMLTSIPLFAISPWVPLIGAMYIVALCISTYLVGKRIEKDKTTKELPTLEDPHLDKILVGQLKGFKRSFSMISIPTLNSSNREEIPTESSQSKPMADRWRFHSATSTNSLPYRRISITPPSNHKFSV